MTHWRTPHKPTDLLPTIRVVVAACLIAGLILLLAGIARAQEEHPHLHPEGCEYVEIDDGDGEGRFIDRRCCDPARVWSGDQGNRETAQVCTWYRIGEA